MDIKEYMMTNDNIDKLMNICGKLSLICTNLTNHLSDLLDSDGVKLTDNKVFNIMDMLTRDVGALQHQSHRLLDIVDDEMDDLK